MRDRLIDLEDGITIGEYRDCETSYCNWNKLKEYLNQKLEHSSKYITNDLDLDNKINQVVMCVVRERKLILEKMEELEGDK